MQNIFGDFEQGLVAPPQMILTTPEHDMKVFIDSCKRNNVAKARMALSLGVDINCVTEDGKWSGLTVAAANNALEVVTWLLGVPGLEVNIRTEGDWVLWDEKDKWNEQDKGFIREWTALMFACVKGHHRIVKILVSAPNIDLNIKSFRNLSEKTAAYFAASTSQKFDNYKCLEILTETTGVDWNLKDIFGRIPLVQTIIDGEARRFNRIVNISGISERQIHFKEQSKSFFICSKYHRIWSTE